MYRLINFQEKDLCTSVQYLLKTKNGTTKEKVERMHPTFNGRVPVSTLPSKSSWTTVVKLRKARIREKFIERFVKPSVMLKAVSCRIKANIQAGMNCIYTK